MKRGYGEGRASPSASFESGGGGAGEGGSWGLSDGGGKMAVEKEEQDELLAALGYKVRSSDMADVAQKLEQLEVAMAGGAGAEGGAPEENAVLAHLASESVHYNPADLSNWLDSMLSELNPPPFLPAPTLAGRPPSSPYVLGHGHLWEPPAAAGPSYPLYSPAFPMEDPFPPSDSSIITVDFTDPVAGLSPDCDLHAIPGDRVIYGTGESVEGVSRDRKRLKSSAPKASATTAPPMADSPLPVVLADSQETGIRLVHTLMACAEAVQQSDLQAAEALVKQVGALALSQGGAMRKVATFFAEALARRIYQIHPAQDQPLVDAALDGILQMHFYESCPYLKFAHFTANQAILEAFAGRSRVHVIDFGIKLGLQWPPLMQALALRRGGPPFFRLTGVGPPQPGNEDALQQVGLKLAQLAESINVKFEYRGVVAASLADLEPHVLGVAAEPPSSSNRTDVILCRNSRTDGVRPEEEEEAVAVNAVFELHRLLAWRGAMEKVLGTVRSLRPKIVTMVEQESNHNGPFFLERFNEALHYYSTVFDSLEYCGAPPHLAAASGCGAGQEDRMMTEVFLGRQICNVVACEGVERTERHETAARWRARMEGAGFAPVHLGSNAFHQASMLLELFGGGGDGFGVEERDGRLMLGWHTRPLITTSAWRLADSTTSAAAAAAAAAAAVH